MDYEDFEDCDFDDGADFEDCFDYDDEYAFTSAGRGMDESYGYMGYDSDLLNEW